jgi:calpain-15
MILEKAWAKIHGSFSKIEAGLTSECLHDLTGAPTKDYFMGKDDESLWTAILNGERNQYVMTCGTANSQGSEVINDQGIAGGHAYSLLAGYEVNTHKG